MSRVQSRKLNRLDLSFTYTDTTKYDSCEPLGCQVIENIDAVSSTFNTDTKLDFTYTDGNASLPLSAFPRAAPLPCYKYLPVSGLPPTLPSHVQPPRL